MSQTSEREQVSGTSIVQQAVQPARPRRSERDRTLTEKGREFQKEKVKGLLLRFGSIYERWKVLTKVAKKSVIKQDPSDILQEHIKGIQREESELNSVYDEYRKIDSPAHDMRRKLDRCASITRNVIQNAQSQFQGNKEEIIWPDASSVFASSTSSVSFQSNNSKSKSIHSAVSSSKIQEAAAEYAHTQAVLKIMGEQESHQAELQRLEAEDKLIVADQETAASTRRLQREREEIERKIEKERQEAALLKRQHEENAARKRSVENLKRELQRLEELKRLNAAKAKLLVYNANEFYPTQDFLPQNSEAELPTDMQIIYQASIADQHPPPLRDVTPRSELQNDMRELVKVLAEAMTANRLPIPEPSIFSGDPLSLIIGNHPFRHL